MENILDKPYKVNNKLVFPNTVSDELDNMSCRNTVDGICYYNESLQSCIEKTRDFNMFFEIGKDTICMPVEHGVSIHPLESFRRSSVYPELDGVKTTSILNTEKYEFPPDFSNVVFYNDLLTIENNGITIGSTNFKVQDDSPISFDKNIDINIIILSKSVEYLHHSEIPVRYGETFAFSASGSSLIMNSSEYVDIVWRHITGLESNDYSFQLKPLDPNKKDGDIVTYTDSFNILCNGRQIYVNDRYKLLQYKSNTGIEYLPVFKFVPKIFGYYCQDGKPKKIMIQDIETDGLKGTYKGKNVYRNPGCFGLCEYDLNSIQNIPSKNIQQTTEKFANDNCDNTIILIVLVLVLVFFVCYLITRFFNSKRYEKILTKIT